MDRRGSVRQRHTSPGIGGRVRRGGLVQGADELTQLQGQRRWIGGWCGAGRAAIEPRHDAPRPREPASGPTRAHRHGNGQRKGWSQHGKPPLLAHDQIHGQGPARQADRQPIAQAEKVVVPTRRGVGDRKAGKVGMLLAQQRADQRRVV